MKRSSCLIAAVIGVFLLSSTAHAVTAISNLSETSTGAESIEKRPAPTIPVSYVNVNVAGSFVAGSAAKLTSVTLPLTNIGGSGNISISLASDAGGIPGSFEGFAEFTGPNPGPSGLYTYTLSSPYLLSANTTYWVVASAKNNLSTTEFRWSATTSATSTGDPGWSIGRYATLVYTIPFPPANWFKPNTTSRLMFSIGVASPDTGDFNTNGIVDASDYVYWQNNNGSQSDYDLWRSHFGETAGSGSVLPPSSVPEPSAYIFALGFLSWLSARRHLRR